MGQGREVGSLQGHLVLGQSPGATEGTAGRMNRSRGRKTPNPTNFVCRLVPIQLTDDLAIQNILGPKYWGAAVDETSFYETIIKESPQ